MHILVVDLGLNVIVIFYFAGGKWASRHPAKKNVDLPPSIKPYIRPPPPHTLSCLIYCCIDISVWGWGTNIRFDRGG